MKYNWR